MLTTATGRPKDFSKKSQIVLKNDAVLKTGRVQPCMACIVLHPGHGGHKREPFERPFIDLRADGLIRSIEVA
jgi:hypothetical protein